MSEQDILAAISFDNAGLVPAIAQQHDTGEGQHGHQDTQPERRAQHDRGKRQQGEEAGGEPEIAAGTGRWPEGISRSRVPCTGLQGNFQRRPQSRSKASIR